MNRLVCFLLFILCLQSGVRGASFNPENKTWSPDKYAAKLTHAEHFDRGSVALSMRQWKEALTHFMVISYHFQDSPFYSDALFYSGICFYYQGELDQADKQFSKYLTSGSKLKFFEKTFEFKYHIAELFHEGRKKHLFGVKDMPKWQSAKKDAIALYDEIIAALPGKEMAIQSLYRKGELQYARKEYRDSIDSLQLLTRRFPKHTLAADAYLLIAKIYLDQNRLEPQNPDFLALAQVNLQKFKKSFPGDERHSEVDAHILTMKEMIANGLYNTGRFYERKKKVGASKIYYQDAVRKYPETAAAELSRERLQGLA